MVVIIRAIRVIPSFVFFHILFPPCILNCNLYEKCEVGCGKCEIRVMPTKPSPKITPRTSHISPPNYNLSLLWHKKYTIFICFIRIFLRKKHINIVYIFIFLLFFKLPCVCVCYSPNGYRFSHLFVFSFFCCISGGQSRPPLQSNFVVLFVCGSLWAATTTAFTFNFSLFNICVLLSSFVFFVLFSYLCI